jgi:hypothetical protein
MSSELDQLAVADTVDSSLIDRALESYYFATSSLGEQFTIKQREYAQKHGEATITRTLTEDALDVTLRVDETDYPVSIPRSISETPVRISASEQGRGTDLTLVAVALVTGFPWTDENIVSFYTGCLDETDSDYWNEAEPLFQTYTPPRGVYEDQDGATYDEFLQYPHVMNLDMLTRHHAPPNPWAYAAMAVIYEDTPAAEHLLSKSKFWGDDSFGVAVTFPDRVETDE